MRVYISSTYIDLVEHRAAVARLLRQMGHEVIGMEEYVAEGSRPLDRCLKDVDSAEIYVGIFAWRYGYVPPSPPPPANDPATVAPPRVSVTESEFRRAAGKRPLVFMLIPRRPGQCSTSMRSQARRRMLPLSRDSVTSYRANGWLDSSPRQRILLDR